MKKVYIPAGETVSYESLATDHLVVDGCLNVMYGVKAKKISGKGVICAGTVYADDICIDEIEAAAVVCARCMAKRLDAPEVYATESLAVSCFLSASYVETGRLTVAMSDVNEVNAVEVINLPRQKHSLLGLLITSFIRSLFVRLFISAEKSSIMDADFTPVDESDEAEQQSEASTPVEKDTEADIGEAHEAPNDEELNRFIAMFKLAREAGYTLRIVPGTPEENAPIFDFATESIIAPAA